MEGLSSAKNVRYIAQPFSWYSASSIQRRVMPRLFYSQYISPSHEADDYLRKLLNSELLFNTQWRISNSSFHRHTNRNLIKDLASKAVLDHLSDKFEFSIVVLLRHPIPNALSIIQRNWGLTANAYLNSKAYREKYLDNDLYCFSRRIMDQGDLLSCHVLNWSLENLPVLSLLPCYPNWNFVTYESLCQQPLSILKNLSARLDLGPIDVMADSMKLPSMTTLSSRRSFVNNSDSFGKINNWMELVPPDKAKLLMDIPRRFGINIYSPDNGLPDLSSIPAISIV